MKKILLVFLLAIPFLGFSQQQFTNTDIVCWDSAGVVRSLVREVYKVNGIGQVVSFYDVQTNAAVTVSSGTISYCTDTTAVGVQDYECLDTITQANSFVTNSVTSVHFDGTNYVSWDTLSPTCIDGYARGINSNSFELYTCGTWSNITSYGNGSWYAHSGTVFSQTAADTVEALSFDVHGGKVTFYVTRCIKYFPANAATIYSSNIDSLYTRNDTLFVVNNDASVDTFYNYVAPTLPAGTVISSSENMIVGDSLNTVQQLIDLMQDSIPEHTGTQGSVFFAGADGKPTEDNANLFWDDTNNRLRINNSTGTYATNILGKIWLDDGQSNVAIGESSGLALTTGVNNTLIGDNAGIALTNNNRNVLIGSNAGKNLTVSNNANGDGIVGIGYGAIENANPVSGTYTAIGAYAGQNNTGGFGWTYVGYKSGQGSSGSNTVFMGYESGQNSTGNDNVGIGYRTLKTAGGQNTAIGTNAGLALTSTASSNTYIGYNSGNNVTTGTSNTGVGLAALSNSSGNFNTGVGGFSGQYNTGTYNSYIGYRSGVGVTAGNYNTIIGSHLRAPTTANRSVLIGNDNGNGTNSGAGSGYDTATDMVVIGNMAAASQLAAGDAGREDEGKQGVIIGYNAAKDPVNTDSSIIIGAHAGVGNDKRNIMLLGYGALADQNGQIVLGTSVGNYTQLKSRNYKFNIDQSVTAANDNHVLTYDNATGEIGLEAVAVQGANNGLQVTSNNVELGSGTNAASGTSADLTSNRYIPMNGFSFAFNSGTGTGVSLAANASSWASISARDTKENFEVLDYQSIYNNFRNVNIEKWNYKGSPNRQLGIMAEDFYDVFGKDLGVVHNHEKIETTDALGACMLLIKAQQEKIDELENRIKKLEQK